jgi:hypothetical protein
MLTRFERNYPDLFAREYFCGFEIGEGWEEIVDKACEQLWFIEDIEIMQVKEKFGGLRIYTNWTTDEVDNIINQAEWEASKTCEACGSVENVSTEGKGWISTLCDNCRSKK